MTDSKRKVMFRIENGEGIRVRNAHYFQYMSACKCIATNWNNTFVIKDDGTLWMAGFLYCEDFSNIEITEHFQQVGSAKDWKWVSASYYCCLAVKTDGTLWAIGSNRCYAMGLGNDPAYITTSFVRVGTDTDWEKVYCAMSYSYAAKTNGMLYGAGSNSDGQLGLGDTAARYTFTQIPNSGNHRKVCLEEVYAAILKNDGTIWVAGKNEYIFGYQKVYHTVYPSFAAITTEYFGDKGNNNFIDFVAAATTVHGIKADGNIYVMGLPTYGVYGLDIHSGFSSIFMCYSSQTGMTAVTQIEGSSYQIFAKNNGQWYATGYNAEGQLGIGTNTNPFAFTLLTGMHIKYLSNGNKLACFVADDGAIFGTGINDEGQLGLGYMSIDSMGLRRVQTFTRLGMYIKSVRKYFIKE